MKKSLLAFLVASSIAITGCEDKETIQKLQTAEKTITQLEHDLKLTKADLEKKSGEFSQIEELKKEVEYLKAELKKAQTNIGLQVEIVPLFDKEDIIKHKEGSERDESFARAFVSIPKTNLEWLNKLLIQLVYTNDTENSSLKEPSEQDLKDIYENIYQELLKSAKEGDVIGEEYGRYSRYLGQRNNIATFTIESYSYSGGAHGMHSTSYINVDLIKQSKITLEDLFIPKHHPELKESLWNNYSSQYYGNAMADKKDFRISEDFYFTAEGIKFVYPPYELAGFAQGNVELQVYWEEINRLISPDYQQTEKDGFFSN